MSGGFIGVSEEEGMIEGVVGGGLRMEKVEGMRCVWCVGLDMIGIGGSSWGGSI